MKKLVKESLYEGVADKYLERTFNIPDETKVVDKNETINKGINVGKILGEFDKQFTYLYKNPTSLENFGNDVRGILMKNGDIYLLNEMTTVKHEDIMAFLQMKNILKVAKGNTFEEIKNNIIYYPKNCLKVYDFAPIERKNRTDTFESASSVSTKLYPLKKDMVEKMFIIARKKHPNFKFIYAY